MSTRNDITGDSIQSKQNTEKFRNNWDLIDWSKKKQQDVMFSETKQEKSDVTENDTNS